MKLDPDLIKKILTAMEDTEIDHPSAYSEAISKIEGYSENTLLYHVRQLIGAGFIDGEVVNSIGEIGTDVFVKDLTWKGHEFVENSRNDTLWNRAKDTIASKVGGISIDCKDLNFWVVHRSDFVKSGRGRFFKHVLGWFGKGDE